ncbi:unnamed protein product, partial [Closterium sp. Naga37s-1]
MAKKEELTGRFSSWASHAVAQSQLGIALLLLPLLACVVLWSSFRARAPIAGGWGEDSQAGSQADQWSVSVFARGAGNESDTLEEARIAGVNRRWGPVGGEMAAGEARNGAVEATRETSREGEAREATAGLTAVNGQAEGVDGREEAEREGIVGSVEGGGVKERGDGQGKARESAGGGARGGEGGGGGGGGEGKGARGGEGGGKEERSSVGAGKGGELEGGSAEGSEGGSEEGGQEGEELLVGCEEMMNEGLSDSSGGEEGGEEAGEKGGDKERDERGEEGGVGEREDGEGKERDERGEGEGEKGGEEEGGQEGEDLLVGCEEMMNEGLSDSSGGEEGGEGGEKESGEGGGEERPGDGNIGEAGGREGSAGRADAGGVRVGSNARDKRSGGRDDSNSGSVGGSSAGSSGDSAAGAKGVVNGSESGGARNGGGGAAGAVGGAATAGGARKKGGGRKEKIKLDVPLACDLYRGSWVPDTSPPLYTNATCPNITRHQNCQGNGRPDSQYERWQWRPEGAACALPRFDAEEFMRVMRGRGVLFVGDSVARNHFESLVCLLSQVEKPEFHGGKSMLRLVFRSSKVTLARVNSAWLVEEGNDIVPDCPDSIPRLHLDRTSPKWFGEIGRFDVVMFSSAHWFVKPSIYMEKGEVIGSQGGWWKRDEPARVDNKGAFAIAIRTVFRDVVKELGKNPNRVFIYRTFSPDHYEKGEWNTGGSCAGLTEPKGGNYTYSNTFGLNLYTKQLEAYNEVIEAAIEAGASVDLLRFTLMDVMPSAGMRVDGHPGPYRGLNAAEELAKYKDSKFPPPQDCLH